jgi:hypothetical protein
MEAARKLSDKIDKLNNNMSREFHKTKESFNSIKSFNSFENIHPPFKEERKNRIPREHKDPKPLSDDNPIDPIKYKIMIAARNCKDMPDFKTKLDAIQIFDEPLNFGFIKLKLDIEEDPFGQYIKNNMFPHLT